MPNIVQCFQARCHLTIGVKRIFHTTSGTRFIRQITLGHAFYGRAKNTLARAWMRFCEHGKRCNARKCADGLHANFCQQNRIFFPNFLLNQATVCRHQSVLGNKPTAIRKRIKAQGSAHIHTFLQSFKHFTRQCQFIFSICALFAPGFSFLFVNHAKIVTVLYLDFYYS